MAKTEKPAKAIPSLDLPVYKPSEVARILRLDPRTVYAMIQDGSLPSFEAGRVIRIPGDAVRSLLNGKKPPSSESVSDQEGHSRRKNGTQGD